MGRRKRKRNRNASEEGGSDQSSVNSNASTSSESKSGPSAAAPNGGAPGQQRGQTPPLSKNVENMRQNRPNAQGASGRPNVSNQQNAPTRPNAPTPLKTSKNAPRRDTRPDAHPKTQSSDAKPSKKNDEPKVDDAWEENLEGSPLGWQFKIGALVLMALLGFGSWVGYQYFFGTDGADDGDQQIAENEETSESGENEAEEPTSSDSPTNVPPPTLEGPAFPVVETPQPSTMPPLEPLDLPPAQVETAAALPGDGMPREQDPLALTEPANGLPPFDTPADPPFSMTIPNASEITGTSSPTPSPSPSLDMAPTERPNDSPYQTPYPSVAETAPPIPLQNPAPNPLANPALNPMPSPADISVSLPPDYASQPEIPPYGGGYGGYGGTAATTPNAPVSRPPMINVAPPVTSPPRSMFVEPGSSANMVPIASPDTSQPTAASYQAVLPPSIPPSGSNNGEYRQYTVLPGDTLFSIAERELGDRSSWVEVFILNKDSIVSDPNRLQAGTTIRLPAATGSVEATAGRSTGSGRSVLE